MRRFEELVADGLVDAEGKPVVLVSGEHQASVVGVRISGCEFVEIDFSGLCFIDVDFLSSSFKTCSFLNADFQMSGFRDCSLSEVSFDLVTFFGMGFFACEISGSSMRGSSGEQLVIEGGRLHEKCWIPDFWDLHGPDADPHCGLHPDHLDVLGPLDVSGSRIHDSIIRHVDARLSNFSGSHLHRVSIVDSRFAESTWSNAVLVDCEFVGGDVDIPKLVHVTDRLR